MQEAFDARDKLYPEVQKKVNQILESGASRFDNLEQALEERATIFQLSEMSETVESLAKKVEALEKENASLREGGMRRMDGQKGI